MVIELWNKTKMALPITTSEQRYSEHVSMGNKWAASKSLSHMERYLSNILPWKHGTQAALKQQQHFETALPLHRNDRIYTQPMIVQSATAELYQSKIFSSSEQNIPAVLFQIFLIIADIEQRSGQQIRFWLVCQNKITCNITLNAQFVKTGITWKGIQLPRATMIGGQAFWVVVVVTDQLTAALFPLLQPSKTSSLSDLWTQQIKSMVMHKYYTYICNLNDEEPILKQIKMDRSNF